MRQVILVGCLVLSLVTLVSAAEPGIQPGQMKTPRIAAVVTQYYHNSHADVLVSRLMQGHWLNGQGRFPKLKLVSLYIDQIKQQPPIRKDVGVALARKHGVPVYKTVGEALRLGGKELAVDGVLLIAEHGDYPLSPRGQILYPKRRMFNEVVRVFEQSDRVVPVFLDKHLSHEWSEAKQIYDTAKRMKIPMMAGSSLPVTWRYPAVDVQRNRPLREIFATSYGPIEGYSFHALEAVQALAERRKGGETGIRSIECITGKRVWESGRRGVYDRELFKAALSRLRERPLSPKVDLEERIKDPHLFVIDYRDGLKVRVLAIDYPVTEWTAAWRYADNNQIGSTVYWTQEWRPLMHFGYFLDGIEQMMHTGKPTWPLERTLLTTGTLSTIFRSKSQSKKVETPYLNIKYQSEWNYQQPPPPPPNRPLRGE